MKVLFLIPYSPLPANFGGAIRMYHILRLFSRDHEVTVAGFGTESERQMIIDGFPRLQGRVYVTPPPYSKKRLAFAFIRSLFSRNSYWLSMTRSSALQKLIRQLTHIHRYDLVVHEFPVMGNYECATDGWRILDAHNVEFDNFRRIAAGQVNLLKKLFYRLEMYKFRREELAMAARQDMILTTSVRDAHIFQKEIPGTTVRVIPNGVDMDFFTPDRTQPDPWSLVYIGVMSYTPNHDAMMYFLDEIFPLIKESVPEAGISVVGGRPSESLQKKGNRYVTVTGFVDDVRPYMNSASVYVVPLRMGGGTRLKILEAMSMGIPVVSTSIGCEGLDVVHNESIMIADTPEVFAETVITLLRDTKKAGKIADKARQLAKEKYSWEVVGDRLREAIAELRGKEKPVGEMLPQNSLAAHESDDRIVAATGMHNLDQNHGKATLR